MLQGQNDGGLVTETRAEGAGQLPCIKNIIKEGVTGSSVHMAMEWLAEDCHRQKIEKGAALNLLLECNTRNVPRLLEQEIIGIVYSVYTKGAGAVTCDEKMLNPFCDKEACRLNGGQVAVASVSVITPEVVPAPIKALVPSPIPVMPEPVKALVPSSISVVSELVKLSASSLVKPILTIDHFPDGWLKEYAQFALPLTEASLQYHLATALTTISTVIGRKAYLCAGATTYYPNLFIAILGPSGITRKSTAIGLSEWFLSAINPEYILSGNQMSLEAFLDAFRTSPTHIIIYDELRNLVINANKPYGRGLIPTITSLWSCPSSFRIDIKKLPPDQRMIIEPTLNILAATTMSWLNLQEDDVHGGFFGRFLFFYADSSEEKRLPIRPDANKEQKDRLIAWLLAIYQRPGTQYKWQPEAQEYFIGVYNDLRDAFDGEPHKLYIGPYWSRIDAHIIKLAMIFDAASYAPMFTITLDNLKRAKAIMDIITGYYRTMLNKATFSKTEKKERQILDILEKACPEWVSHSVVMHDLHLDCTGMKQAMGSLEEKERIEIGEVRTPGAKKKAKQYRLKR